ncbi:MAG: phosphate ABC transporter permease PstA [Sumerlaeia bacterium]
MSAPPSLPNQKKQTYTNTADSLFRWACAGCAILSAMILAALLFKLLYQGLPGLNFKFLTSYASRRPTEAGLYAALVGTLWLISITAAIAVPLGVSAAIYLEEYSKRNKLSQIIETNITNLAGVPSIVYGILGLAIFVRLFDLGFSLLAGALTLAILVVPIIIVSSREAIKAVPDALRHASYAMGATQWQTTYKVILPAALPGILTGIILSLSRAIGETAPLILAGAATYIAFTPNNVLDQYTALPIQIYDWASRPQEEFKQLAASGIIVLLFILFMMNGLAIFLRQRYINKL